MPSLWWKLLLLHLCLPLAVSTTLSQPKPSLPDAVCIQIGKAISSASQVFHPGDALYDKGIYHYASSSSQNATCVVEAGSPQDVAKMLVILGKTRTPFAVKGGGHILNPGFSSTTGVHISMYRFSEIKYNAAKQTVDLGAGLIWDDVYAALNPLGVTAVGGRITGIGVSGFLLGGGYAYKSNQVGLGVDNTIAFQLVKPTGDIVTVTKNSDPQLFFGLKGGYNNFGIVTKFTVNTFPQTQVWGGTIQPEASTIAACTAATVAFQNKVTDPKAGMILGFTYVPTAVDKLLPSILVFYDAPTPPAGMFDDFLALPSSFQDISTRSFLSLVQAVPTNMTAGLRQLYHGTPVISFSPGISDLLVNETSFWGNALTSKGLVSAQYVAEMFLPSVYSHSNEKVAFPPVRNIGFNPYNVNFVWSSPEFDSDFHQAAISSAANIKNVAVAQGQKDVLKSFLYPNNAITGTPLQQMYGDNLPALRALKARVDPNNVMGLAGGWKF